MLTPSPGSGQLVGMDQLNSEQPQQVCPVCLNPRQYGRIV